MPKEPPNEDLKQQMLDSINTPILKALDGEGITLSYLTKCLKKELKAKRIQVFNDKGKIIYSEPLEALEIRQRARQDAHKLRGDYPAEEHKITGDLIEPRSPEERKILQEIARTVAQTLRKQGKK